MPRVRRRGHVRRAGTMRLSRAETIAALLDDPWGVLADGLAHPLLAKWTPSERAEILHAVECEEGRRGQELRLEMLRDRLRTWPVERWHELFRERPDLEDELTAEQQAKWEAWLHSRQQPQQIRRT